MKIVLTLRYRYAIIAKLRQGSRWFGSFPEGQEVLKLQKRIENLLTKAAAYDILTKLSWKNDSKQQK